MKRTVQFIFLFFLPLLSQQIYSSDSDKEPVTFSSERFVWDHTSFPPRLLSHELLDYQGTVILCTTYAYDGQDLVFIEVKDGTGEAISCQEMEYDSKTLSYKITFSSYADRLAHLLFGKSVLALMGYFNHPSEMGTYGHRELCSQVRITAINGILNLRDNVLNTIKFISEAHGGNNIHYIYYPTQGWSSDLMKSLLVKCGYLSQQSYELAETWKRLIEEMGGTEGGGLIIHYAHSIGGTNTLAARHLLTPEEQKMIRVITIGSATVIPNEGFESVRNFTSCRDGIYLLDPVGYTSNFFEQGSNVIYLGSHHGCPFVDHLLTGDTYHRLLEILGQEFLAAIKKAL